MTVTHLARRANSAPPDLDTLEGHYGTLDARWTDRHTYTFTGTVSRVTDRSVFLTVDGDELRFDRDDIVGFQPGTR